MIQKVSQQENIVHAVKNGYSKEGEVVIQIYNGGIVKIYNHGG